MKTLIILAAVLLAFSSCSKEIPVPDPCPDPYPIYFPDPDPAPDPAPDDPSDPSDPGNDDPGDGDPGSCITRNHPVSTITGRNHTVGIVKTTGE